MQCIMAHNNDAPLNAFGTCSLSCQLCMAPYFSAWWTVLLAIFGAQSVTLVQLSVHLHSQHHQALSCAHCMHCTAQKQKFHPGTVLAHKFWQALHQRKKSPLGSVPAQKFTHTLHRYRPQTFQAGEILANEQTKTTPKFVSSFSNLIFSHPAALIAWILCLDSVGWVAWMAQDSLLVNVKQQNTWNKTQIE